VRKEESVAGMHLSVPMTVFLVGLGDLPVTPRLGEVVPVLDGRPEMAVE
jgi:hypothetical protein